MHLVLEIAIASAKIQAGMADCIIAGGAESMSFIPMEVTNQFQKVIMQNLTQIIIGEWVYTAEEVAKQYKITREEQDQLL